MDEKEVKGLEIKEDQPVEEVKNVPEDMVPVETDLEERLSSLESELADTKDKYLRLYAEFENYKKRVRKDREELIKYGAESLMEELLTVLDNLEMAVEHAGKDAPDSGLLEGVELTLKEFRKVLTKHGVKEIKALGEKFDPEFHHAMSQVERADLEDKTIVEEYRKGYMYKDRVLRPALTAVSKKVADDKEESRQEMEPR
jgi:molecular chaperone GrpE